MSGRFESYLRSATDLLQRGDTVRAEGFERLARQTLEQLGSPPELVAKLHAQRGERALRQADYPQAQAAFEATIAALRACDGGGGRLLVDAHYKLGLARANGGADEQALAAYDEAIATAASIGPAFYPAAYVHLSRAESLRRLGREPEAVASLQAALALSEHAPIEARGQIARSARGALDLLRPAAPGSTPAADLRPASPPDHALPAPAASPSAPAPAHAPQAPLASPPPRPATPLTGELAYQAVLAELDGLIGLAAVKAEVHRLAELLRIATMRREAGLRNVQVSLHLVFQGGAGTGKTTVARLFGRLYKSLGLLPSDIVVEVTREDLVSGYVGQTAAKTAEAVNRALGGVLFVDEAYGLVHAGAEADFGPEAVVELLKRMEDDRSNLAVIIAGYPHEMTAFLASNSGFRSRFGETIHFDDYGPDELVRIFEKFAIEADYELQPAAREELQRVMERMHAARDRFFGNAARRATSSTTSSPTRPSGCCRARRGPIARR